MKIIVGRKEEQKDLQTYYKNKVSEFVVVYGRRRVGKTFLIREFFENNFSFQLTGMSNANTKEQLINFHAAIRKQGEMEYDFAATWFEAFEQLIHLLEHSRKKRKVVFLDEMPWLDTPKSSFLSAFEHFWNSWASARKDILLIVCGSATTWITGKLLNNKGGLHNRITKKMYIEPFSLKECEEYLHAANFSWNRYQITESYMIFGGVPYYLSLLKKGKSLAQNVDYLFFKTNGELRNEFENLYASLFKKHLLYVKIVEVLSKKTKGLLREEILKAIHLNDGGGFSKILNDLEQCGFIRKYNAFDKKTRESLFQLNDFFTLFYLKFIQQNKYNDEAFWSSATDSAQRVIWSGYAFEQVCFAHIQQIKKKLGISGVQCKVASWRSKYSDPGAQVDMLIERKDRIVNLCETKFSQSQYAIDKKYDKILRNKAGAFKQETGTRNAINITMITAYGLKQNEYSGMIQNEITLDDLFEK